MNTIKMNKKLAIILTIVLVATMIPIMSFAGDGYSPPGTVNYGGKFEKDSDCSVGSHKIPSKPYVVFVKDGQGYRIWSEKAITNQDEKDYWISYFKGKDNSVKSEPDSKFQFVSGLNTQFYLPNETENKKSFKISVSDGKYTLEVIKDSISHWCYASIEYPEPEKGSISLTKKGTGDDADVLSGAAFELSNEDGYSNEQTTGSNGKVSWSNLEPGEYMLEETKAASGYDLGTLAITGDTILANVSDGKYKVTIGSGDDLKLNATLTATNAPETPDLGSITLTKMSTGDEPTLLSGAAFELSDDNGVISTETTGRDGTVSWSDLPIGDYTLKETKAAEGFDLDSLEIEAAKGVISKNNDGTYTVSIGSGDSLSLEVILNATNAPEEEVFGSLGLTKVIEGTETPISGAAFELSKDNFVDEQITGPDGTISWADLEPGEYILKETQAADGFDPGSLKIAEDAALVNNGDGTYTVTIDPNNETMLEISLEATNAPEIPEVGAVTMTKNDAVNGSPISGAKFLLAGENGSFEATATNGVALWDNIPYGVYTLYETDAAAGYSVTSFKVTGDYLVDNGNGTYTIEISKEISEITLAATNEQTVLGEEAFGGGDGGAVLGDEEKPDDGDVLGEEAKTADPMTSTSLLIMISAALAVMLCALWRMTRKED